MTVCTNAPSSFTNQFEVTRNGKTYSEEKLSELNLQSFNCLIAPNGETSTQKMGHATLKVGSINKYGMYSSGTMLLQGKVYTSPLSIQKEINSLTFQVIEEKESSKNYEDFMLDDLEKESLEIVQEQLADLKQETNYNETSNSNNNDELGNTPGFGSIQQALEEDDGAGSKLVKIAFIFDGDAYQDIADFAEGIINLFPDMEVPDLTESLLSLIADDNIS